MIRDDSSEASKGEGRAAMEVIICDDHAAIRAGLRLILEEENVQVKGACNSVSDLLDLVRQFPDAVVITDLNVSEVQFVTLLKDVRDICDSTAVIVYSMRELPATIVLCYDAGAAAFVPKSADPSELIKAVRLACKGQRYFPASVASELANYHLDHNNPKQILSARELDIFVHFARGGTVEDVAESMNITLKTAQNLLSQIAKKLDAPRTAFSNLARRYGLLDLD